MLSQEVFKKGLEELLLAFNMELSAEQMKLWYKYCKELKDGEFKKKVKNCILYCRKKPYIADLLNPPQNDNSFEPANAGAYEIYTEVCSR